MVRGASSAHDGIEVSSLDLTLFACSGAGSCIKRSLNECITKRALGEVVCKMLAGTVDGTPRVNHCNKSSGFALKIAETA